MYERGTFGEKIPEPWLYKRRVVNSLENMEYLSRESNQINERCLSSFDGIQSELQEATTKISDTYAEEVEKSREQAAQLAMETGFRLDQLSLDVTSGLDNVSDAVNISGDKIAEQIGIQTIELGYLLKDTNRNLDNINQAIQVSNAMLSFIAGTLDEIRRLITIPNEVEALELADQARISFALGKNDKALEITRKAMALCSTSIPVTAYHIIALASQVDGDYFDETKTILNDYAKLMEFKLQDKGTDEKAAILDSTTMTYPVLHSISNRYGAAILESAKEIYKSISVSKKAACGFVERGLVDDECAVMINAPTIVRELHWSTSLNVLTDDTVSLGNFSSYFRDLDFDTGISQFFDRIEESKSPISREIQLLTGQFLQKNNIPRQYLGGLIGCRAQEGEALDDDLGAVSKNSISYLLRLEPQEQYGYDRYTKTFIAEYVKKNELVLAPEFDAEIRAHVEVMQEDVDRIYAPALKGRVDTIWQGQEEDLLEIERNIVSLVGNIKLYIEQSKTKIEEINKEQEVLQAKISESERLVSKGRAGPEELEKKAYIVVGILFSMLMMLFLSDGFFHEFSFYEFWIAFWGVAIFAIPAFILAKIVAWFASAFGERNIAHMEYVKSTLASQRKRMSAIHNKADNVHKMRQEFIDKQKNKLDNYRRKREAELLPASQALATLLEKNIVQKYYDYKHGGQEIAKFGADFESSILGKIVKAVKSEGTLQLSSIYNQKIDEFLSRIDEAGSSELFTAEKNV